MQLFRTDFYQLAMVLAYIMEDSHNDEVVFEAFVRKIDPKITQDSWYKFYGNSFVNEYIKDIQKELLDLNKVMDLFLQIVLPKVHPALRNKYYKRIKNLVYANDLRIDFRHNVYPDNGIVKPMVPVFQYKGPKWIGQLIETRICLLINSKTGMNTNGLTTHPLIFPNRETLSEFDKFTQSLTKKAQIIRGSTSKILLEASYRRSPSDEIANVAAEIAIKNGWNGTSNVGAYLDGLVSLDKIGGTMAHSFVMSHRTEEEAFINWDYIWPHSTILIDTYDCVEAANIIIKNKLTPNDVRIDSDPICELAESVQKTFHLAGMNQIGSYLSGDFDEKKIASVRHISYQKVMAGSKYVNHGEAEKVNCGFVYKLMQVTDKLGTYYPVKKSNGKEHRSGMKSVFVDYDRIIVKTNQSFSEFPDELTRVNPFSEAKFI